MNEIQLGIQRERAENSEFHEYKRKRFTANTDAFLELANQFHPSEKLPEISKANSDYRSSQSTESIDYTETMEEYSERILKALAALEPEKPTDWNDVPSSSPPSLTETDSSSQTTPDSVCKPKSKCIPLCMICKKEARANPHLTLKLIDSAKILMAAVLGGPMTDQEAKEAILMRPMKMCTDHVDDVHDWMCNAINAKSVSDVECIPDGFLRQALRMFRTLKTIRDCYDGRVPTNTNSGAFKLSLKSFFRTFVPQNSLRKTYTSEPNPDECKQELPKTTPANTSPSDSPRQESSLSPSPNTPKNLFPVQRIQRKRSSSALQDSNNLQDSNVSDADVGRTQEIHDSEGRALLMVRIEQLKHSQDEEKRQEGEQKSEIASDQREVPSDNTCNNDLEIKEELDDSGTETQWTVEDKMSEIYYSRLLDPNLEGYEYEEYVEYVEVFASDDDAQDQEGDSKHSPKESSVSEQKLKVVASAGP